MLLIHLQYRLTRFVLRAGVFSFILLAHWFGYFMMLPVGQRNVVCLLTSFLHLALSCAAISIFPDHFCFLVAIFFCGFEVSVAVIIFLECLSSLS